MFTAITHSYKKHAALSFVLASVLALTACGGGGGGGAKTLKTTVQVDSPIANSTVDNTSADFQVSLLTGTTAGLTITLNSVDVTALFTGSPRTASVYALSGLLKDGTNYFNAKTSGSKTSGVEFTYNAKPEAVMTTLASCSSGVCTVKGETHKAAVTSLLLDGSSTGFSITPASSAVGSDFLIANKTIPIVDSTQKIAADFTLQLTGANGSETTTYISPKSVVKYGAAFQVNNKAMTVIESWLGIVLQAKLNTAFTDFVASPLPHPLNATAIDLASVGNTDTAQPVFLDRTDANACQLVNATTTGGYPDYSRCRLFVSAISTSGTVTPKLIVVDDSGMDSFTVKAKVVFEHLNITLETAVYDGSDVYQGALLAPVTFNNAEFTVNIKVAKETGKIVAFDLAPVPYLVNLDVATPTVGTTVCPSNICNTALAPTVLAAAITTIEGQIVTQLASTASIQTSIQNASVKDRSVYYLVKNNSDIAQSALYFDFTGSAVTEAKATGTAPAGCDSISKVCGAFIGIGGSTYASKDCPNDTSVVSDCSPGLVDALPETLSTSLGSYFKPLNSSGKVAKNFFNATDDITVALSENSLNQLLLAAYQSNLLTYQDQTMTVGDLGDLGAKIINLTSATAFAVMAGDLVTMSFDLQAVPHAAFDAAGVEIILNKLKVQLTLYRACSGSTVATCTALYTSDFTLDAKMLATFGLNGLVPNLPLVSIDDIAVSVVGDVVNTFLTPLASNTANDIINAYVRSSVDGELNTGTVSVIMPAFISSLIDDQVTAMTQPIVQNLDLKNVGLNNKSAELRLQTLVVDSTNEFIQLSASLFEVLPGAAVGGMVRLNLTDSCVADNTLFGCSGYIAP